MFSISVREMSEKAAVTFYIMDDGKGFYSLSVGDNASIYFDSQGLDVLLGLLDKAKEKDGRAKFSGEVVAEVTNEE